MTLVSSHAITNEIFKMIEILASKSIILHIPIFHFQITFCIYGCLFIFEDMTATMVLCGIISQVLHLTLLPSFPYFALTSPQFILAAGKKKIYNEVVYL